MSLVGDYSDSESESDDNVVQAPMKKTTGGLFSSLPPPKGTTGITKPKTKVQISAP
eukprot:Awhi_evm1s4772